MCKGMMCRNCSDDMFIFGHTTYMKFVLVQQNLCFVCGLINCDSKFDVLDGHY